MPSGPTPVSGRSEPFRSGTIAIVGRPNVGKSTLLNRLAGQKISITSDRPQTTRHRIAAIITRPDAQLVFLDSPGYQTTQTGALNRVLNRTAQQVAQDADVVVLVCDARRWTAEDVQVVNLLPADRPVLLAVNKVDALTNKAALISFVERARTSREFAEIVPISARTGKQVPLLLDLCAARLPVGEPLYAEDELTDRSERFLAGEAIREKMFRQLGDELPYASTVIIDVYEEQPALRRIFATILVERDAHKAIVIGKAGARLKRIASEARLDLEKLYGCKVYLEVFVKTRSGWADTESSLRAYGYE